MTVRVWTCLGWVAALALACLAAGCSSLDQIDSWPLLATRLETGRQPGSVEVLGPFVDVQWQESTTQWGLRPLFSVRNYHDVPLDRQPQWQVPFFAPAAVLSTIARRTPPRTKPGEGHSGLQVLALWPLFTHESSGERSRTLFLPLYYNSKLPTEEDPTKRNWALFPIYFGGTSSETGGYQALFPVAGVIKNLFGRDRIRFLLFPLYMDTTSGARRSYNVLFPFFNYATGDQRDSWYFWPFIGRVHRHDNPPHWFFLWPFFWYTEEPTAEERDTRGSAFFPFFGWQEKAGVRTENYVWPLFSYAYNRNTDRTDYVTPWPIVRLGWGPDYDRFQVWPFYGSFREQGTRRRYYLWPVVRTKQVETANSAMDGLSVLVVYRSIANRWLDGRGAVRTDYENVLWPLWYYKRDGQGNRYFVTLELRGIPDPQGWDRFYAFLWRVFEHETRAVPPGEGGEWRSTRALWQAFRYDRNDESSYLRLFPLGTFRRARGRFTSAELLMGLFGYVDKPSGARTIRALFVPWTLAEKEGADP